MPSTREFAIHAMLSQFDKRDRPENQQQDRNGMPPGAILAIVIAALTLLVAMIPLFQCPRFHHWVSSSIPPISRACSPLLTLPEPIQIYILNLVILYRKPTELPFQATV
ncbi:hypothetical protein B9Z19DRAFT_1129371 [Tuber borchii]|uniref:Uncharacterized protein n=1 Tax=Tuber borchii TaxID=42251 RepID=A0A2T6ZMF6_TUBBO|nr:hypothetical protein B9Z19DRAFT_1129371 [Tuber borchii]